MQKTNQTCKNVLKAKIYKQTKIYFLNEKKIKTETKKYIIASKEMYLNKAKKHFECKLIKSAIKKYIFESFFEVEK